MPVTSKSTKELERDLEKARNLLRSWSEDTAGVFLQYGLASRREDVTVKTTGSECGCGCILGIEFEYQYSTPTLSR